MYIGFETIKTTEVIKGYHGKFIHTESVTLAFWEVEAGATIPVHHHVHEQICQVLEGRFELTVDGERRIYEPGGVVTIPSHVPHGGTAITNCKLMDIFSPVREDYKF